MAIKTTIWLCFLLSALCGKQLQAAAPFWGESFPGGIPGNWTTGDLPNNPKLWQYCDNFSECPPGNFSLNFFKDENFDSRSVDNGYAYLLAHDNLASGASHDAWLQTDLIDCTGKNGVFLKFTTYIAAQFSNPETDAVVEVQVNGGGWTPFTVFPNLHKEKLQPKGILNSSNTLLASYHPQTVWLDLSDQAANQSQVRIRWRWTFTGNSEYFWLLDDVELFDANPLHENAVWGALPGQGDFEGGWNGWTVSHLGDTCRWRWRNDGLVYFPNNNPLADATGCSPTVFNGVAMVNPTFCQNNNSASEFTFSTLTSPEINLSGVPAGTRLAVQFHQTVSLGDAYFNHLPVVSVAMSTDGGLTYSDTLDAHPLGLWDKGACGMQTLSLPVAAAGSSKVKLRFIFSGNLFYWVVDDVRILKRYDQDLQVSREFSAVAPNYSTPRNQLSPLHFLARVENLGQAEQVFSTLFLTITQDATQTEVHRDTLSLGVLQPGAVISEMPFPKTFIPPAEIASYTCRYEVKADLPDGDPSNNLVRWKFQVTDTVFGKARNFNAVHAYFKPAGSFRYEVGTCYFIPPNPGKQYAHSVSFAYRGNELMAFSKELQVALYKWKSPLSWGDANLDTVANTDEFELVTMTLHTAKGADDRKLLTVPLDPNGDWQPFELEDSTYYFVTVANLTNEFPMFIAGSEEVDYTAMFWLSYLDSMPMFTSMLRTGDETEFRANAWALRRIPFIQLNTTSLTPEEEVVKLEQDVFEMQPNPTSDQFFLTVENGEMQRQATVEIFDAEGRLQAKWALINAYVSQLPIPVENLSNGVYFVKVTTEAGIGTQKLTVFRE